jgi:N-methylhydantoinase A/oxoprolinase/acetone carboxylase beta subunit
MKHGLGIDAGGTYTDVVIIDFKTQNILAKGKALTTKHDLGIGIAKALDTLPKDTLHSVDLVSLSTTLATNAIVEGTGQAVAVVVLGFDEYDLAKISHKPLRSVSGRVDIQGDELMALDETGLRQAVEDLERCEQPDAYAISGMSAVRNPSHEQRAKAIVESMTGKPVICGHEVNMQLNSIKRTNTAILNARLLPVIAELMDRIKEMMIRYHIRAPLMLVRADGTLMTEAAARRLPVETILSGPAASIWGARYLTDLENGLVVDIGGTTSDIALLIDGQPSISAAGATIGDWATHVRAVDIDTVGLAGDSAVSISRDRRLSLGPRRGEPLSLFCHEYPAMVEEIERLWSIRDRRSSMIQALEFFRILKTYDGRPLSRSEGLTLEALRDGPLSRDQLASRIAVSDPSMVPSTRLESLGLIQRSTLTPTDVMHVRGDFVRWDATAARLGIRFFAHAMKVTEEALAAMILETFTLQSAEYLVGRLLRQRVAGTPLVARYPLVLHGSAQQGTTHRSHRVVHPGDELLALLLSGQDHLGFTVTPAYRHPLIVIGAPASVLGPALAKRIGASLVVPEHAEVANAVGAITSMEYIVVEAILSPKDDGFIVHAPDQRRQFDDLDEAKEWAKVHVTALLDEHIQGEGTTGLPYQRDVQVRDMMADTVWGTIFVECTVRAVGVCKPALG